MNFDEFRASSERERLRKGEQRENAARKSSIKAANHEDQTTEKNLLEKIGANNEKISSIKPIQDSKAERSFGFDDFLEMHQMQSFVVAVLFLDTFASFLEIYVSREKLYQRRSVGTAAMSPLVEMILTGVHSFTAFSIIFFSIEIMSVLIVFRTSIIGHLGYGTDLVIVGLQLYLELSRGVGRESRILNIFRIWRALRLFNSLVSVEKDLHGKTIERFTMKDADCRKLRIEVQRLEADLIKEREAKDAVEEMLLTYKDEVDTLNEALKIAAMDIAEVAQADDDFSSDDDDEESNESLTADDGEKEYLDAISADTDKGKNRDTLLRLARKDGSGSGGPPQNSRSTFVIQDDGSFKMR